jgi:hypothetical protein
MKQTEKLKLRDLEDKILFALKELCSSVPFLTLRSWRQEKTSGGYRPDIVLAMNVGDQHWEWLVECRLNGQPRELRGVIPLMKSALAESGRGNRYALFAAPFLSEESRRLCAEAGLGYVDLAGNVHVSFEQVYIDVRAQDNPFKEKRSLRSLFSAKAGRVLRVLLTPPLRSWKVKDLQLASGVSLGQVSNVRKLLLDREWAEVSKESREGIQIKEPEALLRAWRESYEGEYLSEETFSTTMSSEELDTSLRQALEESSSGAHAVLASYSAARLYVPYVRQETLCVYADAEGKGILKRNLGLKPMETGGNVVVIEPREDDVFTGRVEVVPGIWCTGLVQTWLDLGVAGEHGAKAADLLLQQKLLPAWRESE